MTLTNPFTFFQRPLARSGRKALPMSQTSAFASGHHPAAHPVGGPADDRLSKLLDAVGRLADQQRFLLDALRPPAGASPSPSSSAAAAGEPVPVPPFRPAIPSYAPAPPTPYVPTSYAPAPAVTAVPAGDVRSVVAELFRQHQAAAARSSAREAYVREHLGDLPDAYRRLLPETDDPAALAAAEQVVRRQFRDDLKAALRPGGGPAAGGPAADVGGDQPGGHPPAAAVDYARLSPLQQIALGLRGAVPARPDPRAVVPPAASAVPPHPQQPAQPSGGAGFGAVEDEPDDEPLFVGAD